MRSTSRTTIRTGFPTKGRFVVGFFAATVAAILVAALAGCGDLTAGGATAETTVLVAGDAPDVPDPLSSVEVSSGPGSQAGASETRSVGSALSLSGARSADEPRGELELEFLLLLVTEGGRSVLLTESEAEIEVEFPGETETEVVTRTVRTGSYPRLRVVFTEIRARLDEGLIVDGTEVPGPVDVEFEGDALVVERFVDLDLRSGTRAELLVDMNASEWLATVDPESATVTARAVAEVIDVVRR